MTTGAATAPRSIGIRIKPGFLWVGVMAATIATTFILRDRVHLEPDSLIANKLTNRDGDPWVMVCRSLSGVESRTRQAGFRVIESQMEPLCLYSVTVCEKPATDDEKST